MLPCNDHGVLFWPSGGEPDFVPAADLVISHAIQGRRWRFERAVEGDGGAALLAVSFKGRLLGSGWIGDLPLFLSELCGIAEHSSRLLAAALVRWCEIPVLLRARAADSPAFMEFARLYPEAVFAGWLTADGLPEALSYNTSFQRRQIEWSQLRSLYVDWEPDAEQCAKIVEVVAAPKAVNPLFDVLLKLVLDFPKLAGKLALQWVDENGLPCRHELIPVFFEGLRRNLGLVERNGKPMDLEALLERAANALRVEPNESADTYFVRHIADTATTRSNDSFPRKAQLDNFQVASHVAPFRQYLAQRVLANLESELISR